MAVKYLWSTGETTQTIVVNPDITTTYTLTITDDGGEVATSSLTIKVTQPLPIPPNTNDQLVKCGLVVPKDANITYEYKTDILECYNGDEDRIALRETPRVLLHYEYFMNDYGSVSKTINAFRNSGQAVKIYVPSWLDYVPCSSLSTGYNVVTVPLYHQFVEGQLALVYSHNSYEIINIITATDTTITTSKLENGYVDCVILPLFVSYLDDDPEYKISNCLSSEFDVSFIVCDPVYKAFVAHDTTFLGHDVLVDVSSTSDSMSIKEEQEYLENDYKVGLFDRTTFKPRTFSSFKIKTLCDKEEMFKLRNFLKRRYGQTNAFFMPSGTADFKVVSLNGNILTIANNDHDYNVRPYLAISTTKGYVFTTVYSFDEIGDNLDLVTDINLDSNLTTKDVLWVSVLYFVRLDSDKLKITFKGNDYFSMDLSCRECNYYEYTELVDYDVLYAPVPQDKNTLILAHFNGNLKNENADFSYYIPTMKNVETYVLGKFGSGIIGIDNKSGVTFSTTEDICKDGTTFSDHDWTLECWVKLPNLLSSDTTNCYSLYGDYIFINYTYESLNIVFNSGDASSFTCVAINDYIGILNNNWHHLAVSYDHTSSEMFFHCDGILNVVINTKERYKQKDKFNIIVERNSLCVVDELRFIIDVCMYKNNFVLPSMPFSLGDFSQSLSHVADNATILLSHMNGVKANAGHTYAYSCLTNMFSYSQYWLITLNAEYNKQTTYSTTPKGLFYERSGVVNSNITLDYKFIDRVEEKQHFLANFGTDFTLDMFVYVKSSIIDDIVNGSNSIKKFFAGIVADSEGTEISFALYFSKENKDKFGYAIYSEKGGIILKSDAYNYNNWLHLAMTFDALKGEVKLFIGGILVYTLTNVKTPNLSNPIILESLGGKGNVCEIRLVKKVLYTLNFLPFEQPKPSLIYNVVDCEILKKEGGLHIGNIMEDSKEVLSYKWSTGDTTRSIDITLNKGEYVTCVVTNEAKNTTSNLFYRED